MKFDVVFLLAEFILLHVLHLAFVNLLSLEITEKYFPDSRNEFPWDCTFSLSSSSTKHISAFSIIETIDSFGVSVEWASDIPVSDFFFLGAGGFGSIIGTSHLLNPNSYGIIWMYKRSEVRFSPAFRINMNKWKIWICIPVRLAHSVSFSIRKENWLHFRTFHEIYPRTFWFCVGFTSDRHNKRWMELHECDATINVNTDTLAIGVCMYMCICGHIHTKLRPTQRSS